MVIESENYHALQLLLHLYEGQVDCIYIDPPYNSGATDWKYNNNYVDVDDRYRHSKWLSMMEKRLKLAHRLLKPTGSLIVTIDENELHHLYIMLEQAFRDMTIQMVSIVINRAGVKTPYFRRVEEQALYCFMHSVEIWNESDLLLDNTTSKDSSRWRGLRRRGETWTPSKRPNLVYPVAVESSNLEIVGTGNTLNQRLELGFFETREQLNDWNPDPDETYRGSPVIWPLQRNGKLGIWCVEASTLMELASQGFIKVIPTSDGYTLKYLPEGTVNDINEGKIRIIGREQRDGSVILEDLPPRSYAKSVWNRREHSTDNGSTILRELLGEKRFDFPKSVYTVRDTLLPVVKEDPDAVIVDFFAGSGTTLHATLLLNEADGGRRRCILVTNNEIGPENEKRLSKQGIGPDSEEWQKLGIFESVTRPRVEAAISGERADGTKLDGKYTYADDKPMADGFEASADFLRIRHLNPDEIYTERCFDDLHPILWAASGGYGSCPTQKVGSTERHEPGYLMPGSGVISEGCRYAVLLRESRFSRFAHELKGLPQVTHVWLQARDEASFAEMRAELDRSLNVSWLYRDMYRYFDRDQRTGR